MSHVLHSAIVFLLNVCVCLHYLYAICFPQHFENILGELSRFDQMSSASF